MNNENYNVEDEGVSLSQIFGWIRRKFLVMCSITIALALIIVLGFQFIISPKSKTYNIEFSYENVPNLNDGTFLDGTKFQYRELISFDNLETTKESNAKYKDLNVEKLFEDDKLAVKEIKKEVAKDVFEKHYVIEVPARYFESKEQAKSFLIDLVNIPINYHLNYLENLDLFNYDILNEADNYQDQLNILNSYIDYVRNGYNELIKNYGNVYAYIDESEGKSDLIANLLRDFDLKIGKANLTYLVTEYNTYNYIKDYDKVKDKIHNYIVILNKQIKDKETTLAKLNEQLDQLKNSGCDYGQSVTKLMDTIVDLQVSISNSKLRLQTYENLVKSYESDPQYTGDKDYKADTAIFDKELKKVINVLKEETTKFQSTYKSVNKRDSHVIYINNSVIKTDATSLIIVIGVGLILGLVVGATVAGIMGYNDEKEQNKEEQLAN